MARIRTVKPSLFRHYDLYKAEKETKLPLRLAWIGLFTVCDREGRFKWRPEEIKPDVLPFDEKVDFAQVLKALDAYGFVEKYEVDGEAFGCIPSWRLHQVINVREAASTIPAPFDIEIVNGKRSRVIPAELKRQVLEEEKNCASCGSGENLTIDHIHPFSLGGRHVRQNLQVLCLSCNSKKGVRTDLHMHARGEGKGKGREEEKEEEGKGTDISSEQSRDLLEALPEFSSISELLKLRRVSSKVQASWLKAFPDPVWIIGEIMKAVAWEEANPKRRKVNFGAFLTNWFSRGWDKRRHEPQKKSVLEMFAAGDGEL